jgi:hypothetical protein
MALWRRSVGVLQLCMALQLKRLRPLLYSSATCVKMKEAAFAKEKCRR